MKTSRFALAAAAGLFVGAMAFTPAKAADLGGDCCADLEERVAELEATTVRKGNRVMSVQLQGNVNRAFLYYDDGFESDIYAVDNNVSGTDIQILGSGTMKPGWTVGYNIDIGIESNDSSSVNQDEGGADQNSEIENDGVEVYIESDRFGRLTMHHSNSGAFDGITCITLGGGMGAGQCNGATDIMGGFIARTTGGALAEGRLDADGDGDVQNDDRDEAASNLTWGAAIDLYEPTPTNGVRYDSPAIYGFILSAGAGDDDEADVALRFSKEWNSIRVAAGIGYYWASDDNDGDFETIGGSASVMHVPTGLYASFAAAEQDPEAVGVASSSMMYGEVGITQNFFGPGATSFYAEYGQYEDVAAGALYDVDADANDSTIIGSEATKFALGFSQDFDSVATQFYIHGEMWELDATYDGTDAGDEDEFEDLLVIMTGMNVSF